MIDTASAPAGKTVQVKLLQSRATLRDVKGMGSIAQSQEAGTVITTDVADAERMIDLGYAEAVALKPGEHDKAKR
jgi:hypothetical protein